LLEDARAEHLSEIGALRDRETALASTLQESLGRESAARAELDSLRGVRSELEALRAEHKVATKTLEEISARFLEHVNVTLSRTREEAQQVARMIDEIQASRFWAAKRFISRLFGRSDTPR